VVPRHGPGFFNPLSESRDRKQSSAYTWARIVIKHLVLGPFHDGIYYSLNAGGSGQSFKEASALSDN